MIELEQLRLWHIIKHPDLEGVPISEWSYGLLSGVKCERITEISGSPTSPCLLIKRLHFIKPELELAYDQQLCTPKQ